MMLSRTAGVLEIMPTRGRGVMRTGEWGVMPTRGRGVMRTGEWEVMLRQVSGESYGQENGKSC